MSDWSSKTEPKMIHRFARETSVSRRDMAELLAFAKATNEAETLDDAKRYGKRMMDIIGYLETDDWQAAVKPTHLTPRESQP